MPARTVFALDGLFSLGEVTVTPVDGTPVTVGTPAKPPITGWPAASTPTAKAWTAEQDYRLQSGDTLSGLSATYLQDPGRWKEIWAVQDQAVKVGKSPDRLPAGFVLHMPEEAKARARALGVLGMDPRRKKMLIAGAAIGGTVVVGGVLLHLLRSR